jgi:hypothetical protein
MTDDIDSELGFFSRSKDKNSSSVTMLSETDITVEEDALRHRSTRGKVKETQSKSNKCHTYIKDKHVQMCEKSRY